MDKTALLALPYIMPSQAQKHITHNEALRLLDTLVHLAVIDRDLSTPPGSPAEGDRYIVATSPTADWTGHADEIAAYLDGIWTFCTARAGWRAWVADEDELVVWDGSEWALLSEASINPAALVGVNTTADSTNRLAVKSDVVLVSHDDVTPGSGDMRAVLNKDSAADTASMVFQTGYSGRAEFGLAGDDDWHLKVSPDGSSWYEAVVIDRSSGEVSFPNGVDGLSGDGRETLTANRTYYVDASSGSDSNDGLSSGAGAFASVQKAIDVTAGLDLSIYDVTISLADDSYAPFVLKPCVGAGKVTILGNTSTPANVAISESSGGDVVSDGTGTKGTVYVLNGMKLSSSASGRLIAALNPGTSLQFLNLDFGAGSFHMLISRAFVTATGDYAISGGANRHVQASYGGEFYTNSITVTLTGTPAFASAFVGGSVQARVSYINCTFSGSATGSRYNSDTLTAIVASTSGTLPGDSAGSTSNGGQYV